MKLKQVLLTAFISGVTAFGVLMGYQYFNAAPMLGEASSTALPSNYKYAGFSEGTLSDGGPADFTQSAEASIPAVVHIKTKTNAKTATNNLPRQPQNPFSDFFGDDIFEQFFGGRGQRIIPEQQASGSGVLISEDGYIVTNNHVVEKADVINITLNNKKTYAAKLIGTDPAYDLAVLKIEARGLPYLLYGNSDDVKIGQWVLAIGYPLNLETTVTAGIVSAKSRSLGLNRDRSGNTMGGVESFIQTDAAVNKGNSGGALVDKDGRLIGVNSAIASPTGFYSGYSYAIPVNIVKKVVDDIVKFGTVQRAYLGINFINASDLSEEEKKREGIPVNTHGIYVSDLPKDGGAYEAGIRKGDIIRKLNGRSVNSSAEVQEQVSLFKPGEKLPVTYLRNGKETTVTVTLKNKVGTYDLVTADAVTDMLGADLINLEKDKAKAYGVKGGVVVKKINKGVLNDQTRMKDGFIILRINEQEVQSKEEISKVIGSSKNIIITGFYPGYDGLYEYPVSL
jgi:Do/DeqQ family serine protease